LWRGTTEKPMAREPSGGVQWLDRRLYPGVRRNWDDTAFLSEVRSILRPHWVVLDLGAGRGAVPELKIRGSVRRVVGLDVDPLIGRNPNIDAACIGWGESMPYRGETFDAVVSSNVLEHLERPAQVFAEVARVLRPGGHFLVKTPNRRHYVATIGRMTPHRFHVQFNRLRGRPAMDTFPTHYSANTPERLDELARGAGFRVRSVRLMEGRPEYLRIGVLPYLCGF